MKLFSVHIRTYLYRIVQNCTDNTKRWGVLNHSSCQTPSRKIKPKADMHDVQCIIGESHSSLMKTLY